MLKKVEIKKGDVYGTFLITKTNIKHKGKVLYECKCTACGEVKNRTKHRIINLVQCKNCMKVEIGDTINDWTCTKKNVKKRGAMYVHEFSCTCGKKRLGTKGDIKKRPNCKTCSRKYEINTGDTFGTWKILQADHSRDAQGRILHLCECSCGETRLRRTECVISTDVCLKCSRIGKKTSSYKHGKSKKRIYCIWVCMKSRCYDAQHRGYKYYGGRGIKVCDEWLDSSNFIKWAKANGYKENLTIDRIDSTKGYNPTNCHWVTTREQARNKSNNVILKAFGEEKCIADWIDDPRCVVTKYATLRQRAQNGWTPEKALTVRPKKGNKKC